MDAKEYLKKVSKICKVYREDYCNGCPLGDLFCVIPIYFKNEEEEEVIDRVVKLVENYKLQDKLKINLAKAMDAINDTCDHCGWNGESCENGECRFFEFHKDRKEKS